MALFAVALHAFALSFQVSALAAEQAPRQPGATQDYEIGPGDILKVTAYGHDDLNHIVVVQPDGTFIFPLIGRVKASDMTPKELEQKVGLLLSQGYIRNPQVTVVVQEYRSKTVFVVGEISRPGSYPLSESRTVVEILSRAGPMLPTAGAEVVIVRPATPVKGPVLPPDVGEATAAGPVADRQAQVFRVNIRDLQAGDFGKNIVLRPNDTVFVPQAPKVYVSGEVRNPGAYPFAPGTTVRQAISLAGGFSDRASTGRIRVVRQVDGKARELKVKIDDLVQPGDTVVIKEKLF